MEKQKQHSRRKVLKVATIAGVAVASGWVKPVAEFFVSPAHAQTSAPPPVLEGPDTPSNPAPEPPNPGPTPPEHHGTSFGGPFRLSPTTEGDVTLPDVLADACVNVQDGNFDVQVITDGASYKGSGAGPVINLSLSAGNGPSTGQAYVTFKDIGDDLYLGVAIGHFTGADDLNEGC